MESSRTPRPESVPRSEATPDKGRAADPNVVAPGASATAREIEKTDLAREAALRPHQDSQRLMSQLREANQELVVAAVHAQDLSDIAHVDLAEARMNLEASVGRLDVANRRLAAAVARAQEMAELAMQREEEYRRLSGRLLTLQDEERRRIARELHDSTGQYIVALMANLHTLKEHESVLDDQSRRAIEDSRLMAEHCAREIRTIAYLLHPPLLDEAGLSPAVRWYIEGFTKRSGIQVALKLGDMGRLPAPVELALFRIVQESLANAHRHTSTASARIRLEVIDGVVVLDVQDQGRGLRDDALPRDDAPSPETLGVGIQGMRERVRQLGGTFDIEFTNSGTTVRVRVPVASDVS